MKINSAVGKNQKNLAADVAVVQELLNRNVILMPPLAPLVVDGKCGNKTVQAITFFQLKVLKFNMPDGVISPGGRTLASLAHLGLANTATPKPIGNPADSDMIPNPAGISESLFVDAAVKLGAEAAAIKAIVQTEVGIRGAFDSAGRPTILYERHYFSRLTKGKHDKSNPDISSPTSGGYGKFSEQYPKLERAQKLDNVAALSSASWGAFQIMGANYSAAGFGNVTDFVAAMKKSIEAQMAAFVTFISNDVALKKSLQNKNWATFAKIYNGPSYSVNQYDVKMRDNYQMYVKGKLK